jgi:CMP-N,N'-diacetyllegionaminic acid synthase
LSEPFEMERGRPSVLALIPARGGSRGVPLKNLRKLAGKPLIVWTILAATKATTLDRVIVSTDSDEIAAVATSHGVEVPFMRPASLAEDATPDLPVFAHALNWLRANDGYRPDVIVHLRPTQPLRRPQQIDEVVRLLLDTAAESVKSVRPVREHPHKMWSVNGDRLEPYLQTSFRRRVGPDYPRQELEPLLVSSGLVDAVRTEVVERGSTTGSDVRAFFTDPADSIDLDTELDFEIAEALLGDGLRGPSSSAELRG